MPPPPVPPQRQPSFSSERFAAAPTAPPAPRPTAAAQAAVDNRAVQLNPHNPTYHSSRGAGPQQAAQQARAAAQTRQSVSNR